MAASAAGIAFGWKESGWFFHTRRTFPGYWSITCFSVDCARPQYGHWKSDHSTMVTGGVFAPVHGPSPASTLRACASGAAAGGGAAAPPLPSSFTYAWRCDARLVG